MAPFACKIGCLVRKALVRRGKHHNALESLSRLKSLGSPNAAHVKCSDHGYRQHAEQPKVGCNTRYKGERKSNCHFPSERQWQGNVNAPTRP